MKPLFIFCSLLLVVSCGTKPGDGEIPPGEFSKEHLVAVDYVNEIDSLRSTLARTIGSIEADENTFKAVCKPVGDRARVLSEETGWPIKQVATRYRNPGNKADEQAAAVIARFEEMRALESSWEKVSVEGVTGWRYFQRILIEPSCLACHGDKDRRPAFVIDSYPADSAFGFGVGDIRGAYTVFVPDSTIW